MPAAPVRPCTHPGCRVLTATGRCAAHARKAWAKGEDAPKRITGRRLQRLRAELFARQPLCVLCLAAGKTEPATERDHIVPLALGGSDTDPANTRALCHDCNESERLRVFGGTRRPRIGSDGYPVEDGGAAG